MLRSDVHYMSFIMNSTFHSGPKGQSQTRSKTVEPPEAGPKRHDSKSHKGATSGTEEGDSKKSSSASAKKNLSSKGIYFWQIHKHIVLVKSHDIHSHSTIFCDYAGHYILSNICVCFAYAFCPIYFNEFISLTRKRRPRYHSRRNFRKDA